MWGYFNDSEVAYVDWCWWRWTNTPVQPPPSSPVFQFLYIKSCKHPSNPVWFHPAWPHMGLWSAPHPNPLSQLLRCRPRERVYPCSTRKGNDKVSGPQRYIVCTQMNTHTHAHTHTYSAFTTWAGLWALGWWWWWWWWWVGGGGLGADTFLLTITSHTRTHIPTSWWPPPPPPTSLHLQPVSLGYLTAVLLPHQVLVELCSRTWSSLLDLEEQSYSWQCLQKNKNDSDSTKNIQKCWIIHDRNDLLLVQMLEYCRS